MGLDVKLHIRPYGHTKVVTVTEILDEDAKWFKDNNVKVSMEDIGNDFVVFGDVGLKIDNDPDEEPDEAIVYARGRSAKETFTELRNLCAEMLASLEGQNNDEG